MGVVHLEDTGDKSLRIASESLQETPGADGRRHLPEAGSVSRLYKNMDVSVLNAEGLGVVAGSDGSQTGHEGGLAPLGGVPPAGQCTMHGGIVFSLSKSPTAEEIELLAQRVAVGACSMGGGLRYTDPSQWGQIQADHGAGLIQSIQPRRKRPPKESLLHEPDTDIVALVVGYNGSKYRGNALHTTGASCFISLPLNYVQSFQ